MAEIIDTDPKRAHIRVSSRFTTMREDRGPTLVNDVPVSRHLHDRAIAGAFTNATDFWREFFLEQRDGEWRLNVEALRETVQVAEMRLELLDEANPILLATDVADGFLRPRKESIERAKRFVEWLAAMEDKPPT